MAGYVLRRLISTLFVLLGVVTLTFFLMHATDGDPATIIALDKFGAQLISPGVIHGLARDHGLDLPVHVQFFNWLGLVVRGEFGVSLRSGVPVVTEILLRLPATVSLAAWSMLVCALVGLPLGIHAAQAKDGLLDRTTRWLAAVKVSIPGFYMAMLLVFLFSVKLGWLPSYGTGSARHYILPVGVHVLGQVGFTVRVVRSAMLGVLESDYIQYARVRGLSRSRILYVHAFRNASIPIFTYLSLQFLMVMEGSVIIETIFAWPGVGKLFQEAIFGRDFTMVQALVLFFGTMITLVNFAMDLFYFFLNQKISVAGERT